MDGKIITFNNKVHQIHLVVSPIEYLTIITALQHYSDANAVDVKNAEQLCKDAVNKIGEVKL